MFPRYSLLFVSTLAPSSTLVSIHRHSSPSCSTTCKWTARKSSPSPFLLMCGRACLYVLVHVTDGIACQLLSTLPQPRYPLVRVDRVRPRPVRASASSSFATDTTAITPGRTRGGGRLAKGRTWCGG